MASGAGGEGLFRSVYSGCISNYDNCVERRPYHRNCGCALHNKSPNNNCTHKLHRCNNVSYPIRRAWSEGNLVLAASSIHFSPPPPSSSSSPSIAAEGRPPLSFCKHLERGDKE